MTLHSMKGIEHLNMIPKSLNKTVWCGRGNMLLCRDIQLNAFTLHMVSDITHIYLYLCYQFLSDIVKLNLFYIYFWFQCFYIFRPVSSKAWNMLRFDKMCHHLSRRWTLQSFSDATASIYHNYSLDIRYAIHLATTATSPKRCPVDPFSDACCPSSFTTSDLR